MTRKKIILKIFRLILRSLLTLRNVMILESLNTRTNFRRPKTWRITVPSSNIRLPILSNGIVAKTSIANLVFRYWIAIKYEEVTSSPVLVLRKDVLNCTIISRKKPTSMKTFKMVNHIESKNDPGKATFTGIWKAFQTAKSMINRSHLTLAPEDLLHKHQVFPNLSSFFNKACSSSFPSGSSESAPFGS